MIRLDLTPAQARSVRQGAGHIILSESQAKSVRGKVTAAAGAGRPKKIRACPWCHVPMSTSELRIHQPRCSART